RSAYRCLSYTDPFGLCPPKILCDLIGASAGETAVSYWADRANGTQGVRKAGAVAMGLLASLWTPDTYGATAATLAAGAGASAALRSAAGTAGSEALGGEAPSGNGTFYVDSDGNVIPTPPGGSITG